MPVDHQLACHHCKEFIELHKWWIIPNGSADFPRGFEGKKVSAEDIRLGIASAVENSKRFPGLSELAPVVSAFVDVHARHDLRMHDDCGDAPWQPEYAGYCEWKGVKSCMTGELFLPRNLVDDLQIRSWQEAEAYLKALDIYLYEELELVEYRANFSRLTESQ
jgi:hypothetical protein